MSSTATSAPSPTLLEPHGSSEMLIGWSTGERFAVAFTELRYQCPCASCVDEHTGQRIIRREHVKPDTKVVGVQLVGRYAVQISYSDGHGSGIYPFDKLLMICQSAGLKLA